VLLVRQTPKAYGTCRLVAGGEVAQRRVVIVEDVVTSGGQIQESARALRFFGAHTIRVVGVIDRDVGGRDTRMRDGLELVARFRMHELHAAVAHGVGREACNQLLRLSDH
jgi:orotate phosphoribosyltransferase